MALLALFSLPRRFTYLTPGGSQGLAPHKTRVQVSASSASSWDPSISITSNSNTLPIPAWRRHTFFFLSGLLFRVSRFTTLAVRRKSHSITSSHLHLTRGRRSRETSYVIYTPSISLSSASTNLSILFLSLQPRATVHIRQAPFFFADSPRLRCLRGRSLDPEAALKLELQLELEDDAAAMARAHASTTSPAPARTPRRAGVRPASPYARAPSVSGARPHLRPLSLSLSFNVPPCAVAASTSLCSPIMAPRVRRHAYSASAPCTGSPKACTSDYSSEDSPCPPSSCSNSNYPSSSSCPTSSASASFSCSSANSAPASSCPTSASDAYYHSKQLSLASPNSSSCVYSCPASAAAPSPSPLTISVSSLDGFGPASPSSPASVYFSCPTSPLSASAAHYPTPLSLSLSLSGATFSPRRSPFSPASSSPLSYAPAPPPPTSSSSTSSTAFSVSPTSASASSTSLTYLPPPAPSTSHSASPLHASTPPSFSHITPHIAIADLAFAENPDLLKREGVTHVVSVLSDRAHIPAHIPPSNRLHVPLDDAPFAELVGLLGPVVQWVEDALRDAGVLDSYARREGSTSGYDDSEMVGGKPESENTHIRILIHCAHGISRSPAVGAALLVALPLVDGPDSDSDTDDESDSTQAEDTAMETEREEETETENECEEQEEMQDQQSTTTIDASTSPSAGWTSPVRRCASPASLSFSPLRLPLPLPLRIRPSPLRPSSSSSLHTASTPAPAAPAPAPAPAHSATAPNTSASASASGNPSPARRMLSAPAALAYVAARRPAADVNWGFRAQLREWEGVCRAGSV